MTVCRCENDYTEYITPSALKNLFRNGDEMPKLSLFPRPHADKPFVSIIIHEHGPVDYFNCIRMSLLFNTSASTKHSSSLVRADGEMGGGNARENNIHCAAGGCGKVPVLCITREQQIILCDCRKDTWITTGAFAL